MRILSIFLIATTSALLSACGFTPLYEDQASYAGSVKLPQIHLSVIDGKNEHQYLARRAFANSFSLTDGDYKLRLEIEERSQNIGLQQSAQATRFNLKMKTKFWLTKNDEVIVKDTITTVTSYNVVNQQYATFVGLEDARRKTINDMAKKLELRMALQMKQ